MPTDNIEITEKDIEIRVVTELKCGQAHIVDVTYLKSPESIAFVGPNPKRFFIFVCCEGQKDIAEESISDIQRICNNMVRDGTQAYMVETQKWFDSSSKASLSKRTIH